MRLDRFLSEAGVGTRKELREMIRRGRVTVDGVPAAKPEMKLSPESRVAVDGALVNQKGTLALMLNKPAGYVTSTADPRDRTVMELLPPEYQDLFPVGRLDKDTEGLLLFTNDGALAHRLTAPKRRVEKEYFARTDGVVDQTDAAAFQAGLELRDGTRCLPAVLTPTAEGCRVVLHEGKYHQVRRMLAARGKPVLYLRREREGPLTLEGLPLGEYRLLTPAELAALNNEVE